MARLTRGEELGGLEEIIGLRFPDRSRLERALTHASLKSASERANYERLEFLGDRVLGLTIAERLFQLYPKADEGELSLRLNALVSAETCAEIADEIGLERFIRHGGDLKRIGGERNRNIRADVVEAMIAAIHLDHGIEAARDFILRFWDKRLGQAVFARRDPKTALQEWAHKKAGRPPSYDLVERSGPDHDPLFTVLARVDGVEPATGQGRSKRLAEQEAAATILVREGVWSAGA
ncbi:ribonuclease III [Aureimonas populi]|uniref:Ribonuclease 3 n=1 Tax=Aureimonas populi TaxID=1701758 RepID=A0ABW5CFC2_9HYPH|nr:ribonuclease III [Aureimonas populi]